MMKTDLSVSFPLQLGFPRTLNSQARPHLCVCVGVSAQGSRVCWVVTKIWDLFILRLPQREREKAHAEGSWGNTRTAESCQAARRQRRDASAFSWNTFSSSSLKPTRACKLTNTQTGSG